MARLHPQAQPETRSENSFGAPRGSSARMAPVLFCWLLASIAALGLAGQAGAETSPALLAQEDRIAELERTVAVLADELERTRRELAMPEEHPLVERYGRAPGASKIYGISRGLSIGGYGEGHYTKLVDNAGGNKDRADLLRLVLYTGYKFTDNILFNAEIEFEHATTGSTQSSGDGSVSVEFAHLDFLIRDWLNVRAGLVLVPMGLINEIHEPNTYFGVNRPEVERKIIPATWRENGVGSFGTLFDQLEYEAYVINGFNAEGFDSGGLRGGRQKGNRALAEHLAFVGRLDWSPFPQLNIGGSVYYGKSGQNQNVGVSAGFGDYTVSIPDTPTTVWELHAQYENRGVSLRSLFTMAEIGDSGDLTRALGPIGPSGGTGELGFGEAVGGEMLGVYGEIAYELLQLFFPYSEKSLEPFFRFEYYDTQRDMPSGYSKDKSKVVKSYTMGFSFQPIPNVVIKADYRNRVAESGGLPDEFNLGMGFVF